MSFKKKDYIYKLCTLLNVDQEALLDAIKIFEQYIKLQTKGYDNNYGFEDIKMNKYDFYILYNLYINTNDQEYKFQMILYYIYSVYKLEGMAFDIKSFPFDVFFNFLNNNTNISSCLFSLLDTIENDQNKPSKRIKI